MDVLETETDEDEGDEDDTLNFDVLFWCTVPAKYDSNDQEYM